MAINDKRIDEQITRADERSVRNGTTDESQSRVAERACAECGSYDDQQIHRNKERIITHESIVK